MMMRYSILCNSRPQVPYKQVLFNLIRCCCASYTKPNVKHSEKHSTTHVLRCHPHCACLTLPEGSVTWNDSSMCGGCFGIFLVHINTERTTLGLLPGLQPWPDFLAFEAQSSRTIKRYALVRVPEYPLPLNVSGLRGCEYKASQKVQCLFLTVCLCASITHPSGTRFGFCYCGARQADQTQIKIKYSALLS